MDLGSLELQIFVSLTVVLGGAFVALVCDYLKGNNEQLREHNIELRVRKEEQERRLLLDPAGFLGQWLPGHRQPVTRATTSAEPSVVSRAVAPHEVMHSFADPDVLAEAEERAAKMHARVAEDRFENVDVPPLTNRRNGRNRSNRKSARQLRKEPENYADWVRPEVIAKVALRAQATNAYSSDIREDLETLPEDALPEPLNAAESWDIRQQLPASNRNKREASKPSTARTEDVQVSASGQPAAVPATMEPATPPETVVAVAEVVQEAAPPEHLAPEDAVILQKEIERVAQMERRPVTAAPGTILRPLTVPSLKLEEELQRVAEIKPAVEPGSFTWNSALLDEVIAASGAREVIDPADVTGIMEEPSVAAPESVVIAEVVEVEEVVESHEGVEAPGVIVEAASAAELAPAAEEPEAAVPVADDHSVSEITLDHHEYWEQPVISNDGGSFPDTVFPSSEAPIAFTELPFPVSEAPVEAIHSEIAALEAIAETPVVEPDVEQQPGEPEIVEYIALLPEPAAVAETVASTVDSTSIELPISATVAAETPEPEMVAQSTLPELTLEIPLALVEPATIEPTVTESQPLASEPEGSAFADAYLPAELIQPSLLAQTEPEVPVEEPVASRADSSPLDYLIESAPEAVDGQIDVMPLAVVFEADSASPVGDVEDSEPLEQADAVPPPPFYFELESAPALESVAELLPVEPEFDAPELAAVIDCYTYTPRPSRHARMGISPSIDYVQSVPGVETLPVQLALIPEPALEPITPNVESLEELIELPELLPEFADLPVFASPDSSGSMPELAASIVEPPPLWTDEQSEESARNQNPAPVAPIDISALRHPEPEVVASAPPAMPDLLLPTGMHDISTWTRLMALPNPMTGILILISLQSNESRSSVPQPKAENSHESTSPAIEKFMASFVREGDFGSHISENEWVFIYSNDVAGFNQRRVGMISEKLWDFQLRHLGLANVNFKWGAIDVQSEPLPTALGAARDRMNQTNRSRKLPGADRVASRRVVNG